jgi:DNA-binding MarR family transcriptional regulator
MGDMSDLAADDGLALPPVLLEFPSFLLLQVIREARRIGTALAGGALRAPHITVLAGLAEFGPASQKEISARLRIDASDLVSLIDDLERGNLASRRRDVRDRRRYVVTITEPGRVALHDRLVMLQELNDTLLAPLGESDRARLREMLLRLHLHHHTNVV